MSRKAAKGSEPLCCLALRNALSGLMLEVRRAGVALEPVVEDIAYFIGNYDPKTGRSRQRYELRGLGNAVLDLLAENLPKMIEVPGPVPERCVRAAAKSARGAMQPVDGAALARAASDLWKGELRVLLQGVRSYRLYQDYELIDYGQREILTAKELRRRRTRAWRVWTAQYRRIGADLWC